jgi:hypothetical protein
MTKVELELKLWDAVSRLRPRPVAIEAFWDGDPQGWFVDLSAVVVDGDSFRLHHLTVFNGGGDIRLFNGTVPPWSEAEAAAAAGRALGERLGVPFFFPSPAHPEDDCPHWWEQDEARPCKRCGILLLQPEELAWRGHCHHCQLRVEREAREAAWTPEERAAPQCHVCGTPAVGEVGLEVRCGRCRDAYEDWTCCSCGIQVMSRRSRPHGPSCDRCSLRERLARVSPDDRRRIQEIETTGRLDAILALRDLIGGSISDADQALDLWARDGEPRER